MKSIQALFFILFFYNALQAQFAPQAGLVGSTAIHKDSSVFKSWGSNPKLTMGFYDIADMSLGTVMVLDSSFANGIADGAAISLGDGGEAIYTFQNPIVNGAGFDFAIFENGFRNPVDSNQAFLELAKVSVSNDGITYFSFASTSNTDTLTQIPGFGTYMDCRKLNNLAGKYINQFGTPFDLNELSNYSNLNLNAIRYVKIKDVVGTLDDELCSRDQLFQKINDPYPTPFASAGFDLDALGVIHQQYPTEISSFENAKKILAFPNPCSSTLHIETSYSYNEILIKNVLGQIILHKNESITAINTNEFAEGLYYLQLFDKGILKDIITFQKRK